MTWSYSGDPSSSSVDAIRFLLGDTDHDDPLTLSNEEITWLISEWDSNLYLAAAAGAEQLAGQFAKEVTYAADGVTYTGTELQQKYRDLAQSIRVAYKRKGRLAVPYDGSNDNCDWWENVERIRLGMHDVRREGANIDTGSQNGLSDLCSPGGLAEA